MTTFRRAGILLCAFAMLIAVPARTAFSQPAAAPAIPGSVPNAGAPEARGPRAPAEFWYMERGKAGVYTPPMRPLWKLSELLHVHAGQNDWSEQIIKDNLQDVTYHSAGTGSKILPRMHMETDAVFVVMKGTMHFNVEGQAPVTATRGGIVNVLNDTIYSYSVDGAQNALWVEIHPLWYQTVYPATEPMPPVEGGKELVKVSFAHRPPAYTDNNRLYFNLFEAIASCQPVANVVNDDHIHVSPLLGWVNPADNKCGGGSGNIGSGPDRPDAPPFVTNSTFGHLHHGVVEWWIIQSGAISGKFENTGEFHAVEGDVLYAAPDMWHQMAAEAPSGPSVRTAIGGYQIVNMNNTGPANGR